MQSTGISPENLIESSQSKVTPRTSGCLVADLLCSPWFSLGLIILICVLCYGRTLGSYFLADDIGQLRYIQQIFSGRWDLFWSNFCGNYMQVPNMSVYRPMLLLTLVFDYLCWKANPLGYYLSNLIYFTVSASLLSIFIRQLCQDWGRLHATLAGLASACLFACYPLHCESVSWVVGRVDSACCMFYLASLCIFMSRKTLTSTRLCALAVFFFILAICTKEMAVGLAPVLFAIAFIFPQQATEAIMPEAAAQTLSFLQRLGAAWRLSRPIWIATAIYFVCRYLALGTLLGGYNGSVGATQTASAVTRWLDGDNWRRLLMPFPYDLYGPGNGQEQALFATYCALAFLVCLRLLANSLAWRYLAFLFFWGLTLAAPIYRLWGLGANLEGGRFCFFLSLALSSLLPILILAPDKKLPASLSVKLSCIGMLLIAILASITGHCTYATNLLWLHAGKEVKAVRDEAIKLSRSCASGEKIILLGVPKQHSGAHMILNGATLQMLCSPPFTDRNYWSPFLTFDPILFGDENLVNGSRLRFLVNKSAYRGPYVWSNASKHFDEITLNNPGKNESAPLNFPLSSSGQEALSPCVFGHGKYTLNNGVLKVSLPQNEDGVRLSNLHINPLAYAYLKVSFRSTNNKIALPFQVRFQASENGKSLPEFKSANFVQETIAADMKAGPDSTRTIYIPLGRNWHWYAQTQIEELSLYLPGVQEISLTEISLLPAEFASPVFNLTGKSDNYGVTNYLPGSPLQVRSAIGNQLLLQLSKKQFFFDNLGKEDASNGIAAEFRKNGPDSELAIPSTKFEGEGYYQLRARALDNNGRPLGDYSDTLTLSVK